MSENNAESTIKLSFDDQMRRFPFQGTSFAALHDQIISLLGLDKTADIVLKYADEDGDFITISSDLELKSALVPGQLLRIVGAYRNNTAEPAIPSTPFGSADPFQSFGRGCGFGGGRGGWHHTPGGPFSNDKDRKKAHKLFKKMRGSHGGWGYGPRGGHGPHGGPHRFGPHGGPPGFPPHGGPPGFPPHGGPPGFPPHDGFGPQGPLPGFHPAPDDGFGPHPPGFPPHFPPHEGFGHHPHHGGHHGHGRGHHGFGPMGHHGFGQSLDGSDKLVARFAKDVTVEDGTQIPANTPFVKTWRIRNEGVAWPAGCVLRFVGKHSDDMGAPEFVAIDGIVGPGQDVEVSVNLVAPAKPGRYTGYWKMCTPDGRKFGQRVWVSIVVPSNGSSSEGEKEADLFESLVDVVVAKESLRSFGVKRHRVFRLLQKCGGDVDQVIALLTEKLAKKEAKCALKAEKCARKAEKHAEKHAYKQGEWKH